MLLGPVHLVGRGIRGVVDHAGGFFRLLYPLHLSVDLSHLFKLLLVVAVTMRGQDGKSLQSGPGDTRLD